MKVFDVNLRQSFYSFEVLAESMKLADIVKLNDEELPKIMKLAKAPNHKDELSSAQLLIRTYDLKMVCITRGGSGSLLVRDADWGEHPGFRVSSRTPLAQETLSPRASCTSTCKAHPSIS